MKASIAGWAVVMMLLSGCVSMRPAPSLGSLEPPPAASAPTPPSPSVIAKPSEPIVEPAQPPAPAPSPPAQPSAPPREPRVTAPASPPPVAKPAPPEPAQAPPPPVVVARLPHEDQIAQEVTQRVARVQEIIDKIDAAKLSRDQREILSSIQDFVEKAKDASQTKDMSRAQVLAEKASKLADDLAAAVKR